MTSFIFAGVIYRLLASFINNFFLLAVCLALMIMLQNHQFFCGIGEDTKLSFVQLTGFSEGRFPFKYLGMPLSSLVCWPVISPLLHKLESSIQSWMGKHLSYASQLELIRSILHGMVQFQLAILFIPVIVNKINSLCRSFLWSGNHFSNHSALVAWHKVCLPQYEGGLGLLDINARNKCFLAKQLWNIH